MLYRLGYLILVLGAWSCSRKDCVTSECEDLCADAGCEDTTQDVSSDTAVLSDTAVSDSASDVHENSDVGTISDGLHPTLFNFHIDRDNRNRVLFDSSEPLRGARGDGFIVTGNRITSLTLSDGTSGHFFECAEPFDFWDNTTIRYEGGSDIEDHEGNELHTFTLRYIRNDIPEPQSSAVRFVSASATGSGDGLSEQSPWTLQQAGESARPGMTVWVRAGDYGSETFHIRRSGTQADPIKFIGYRSNPGDEPGVERDLTTVFSDAALPFIHKQYTGNSSDVGIDFNEHDYIVLRNFMVEGFYRGIDANNTDHVLVDQAYVRDGFRGIVFWRSRGGSESCRVTNSLELDQRINGITINGVRDLVAGNFVGSTQDIGMDYYIVAVGSQIGDGHHIIRDNTIHRFPEDSHPGHGIDLKKQLNGSVIEHSLIEDCTLHNTHVSLRHHTVRYNIVRNITAIGNVNQGGRSGMLVRISNNTNHNIIENSRAINTYTGVRFMDNIEEDEEDPDFATGQQPGGHHNHFQNIVFQGVRYPVIDAGIDGNNTLESTHNTFVNCTFFGAGQTREMFTDAGVGSGFGPTNRFVNSIIVDVPTMVGRGNFAPTFEYTNFYDAWRDGGGVGNVSIDPGFVDAARGNLALTSSSPMIGIGIVDEAPLYDLNGQERGPAVDLGAIESMP